MFLLGFYTYYDRSMKHQPFHLEDKMQKLVDGDTLKNKY